MSKEKPIPSEAPVSNADALNSPHENSRTISSPTEMEYRALIAIVKYSVTGISIAISLVISVAAVMLMKDRAEIKKELQDSITDAKASFSSKMVIAVKKNALQIDSISEVAKRIAESEAQKRITEEFRSEKLQKRIDETARYEVGDQLRTMINKEIGKKEKEIEKKFSERSRIITAAMQMRIGVHGSIYDMKNLMKHSSTRELRDLAKSTFEEIANDYEEVTAMTLKASGNDYQQMLKVYYGIDLSKYKTNEELIEAVIPYVDNEYPLDLTCLATLYLEKLTKQDFEVFDIEDVMIWQNQYLKEKRKKVD